MESTLPVIILNWNGFDDTVACVDAVLKQSYHDIEIFLIDNASDGHEFERLKEKFGYHPQITLIQNNKNLGFGKAHNNCFELLINKGHQTVALINNDAEADEHWLAAALETMHQTNADIVGCKMVDYYDRLKLDSAGLFMLNTGEILPRGHGKSVSLFQQEEPVISFCAGACLITIDVIKELGGFDDYFDTGYEDAELGLRAFLAGKKIIYSPLSIVYHKMGQSLNKVISYKRTRKIQQDINYTYLKNIPTGIILINFPFYILRSLFVIIIHILSFRFRYPAIWCDAIFRTFIFDLNCIIKYRKTSRSKSSLLNMIKAQRFFLCHDLYRFNRFLIKGTPHKFEQK